MTDLALHLGAFLREHLPRDRRASRHTVESYAASLKLLVIFAADRLGVRPCLLTIEQLSMQLILDFLAWLERERHNTVATRNVRLAAIKAFFRFLEYRSPVYLELSGQIHAIAKKRADQKLIDWLAMSCRPFWMHRTSKPLLECVTAPCSISATPPACAFRN